MPRKKRIWSPYHFNHVVMRGNNRQNIFNTPQDIHEFFRIIYYTYHKYPFTLVAYCIMSNHYHLLIRSPEVPLGKIMAIINRRYSDYYKKRYNYTGQLYERRYYADMITSIHGVLAVSRYIHRNPISTSIPIVQKMEYYPYNSFLYYKKNIPSPYPFLDTTILPTYYAHVKQYIAKSYIEFCEIEIETLTNQSNIQL